MDDLAVIIVSTNEARWLGPCLSTLFEHLGDLRADVVVADNHSTDGTRELVEREFPAGTCRHLRNHGFGHANNRGAVDDERPLRPLPQSRHRDPRGIIRGARGAHGPSPRLGLVGVKQITPDGRVFPTIRRFPNAARAFFPSHRLRAVPASAHRGSESGSSTSAVYEFEVDCDWTSGSFMLARREALESAGFFDERFFIYSEETDLCLRIKWPDGTSGTSRP